MKEKMTEYFGKLKRTASVGIAALAIGLTCAVSSPVYAQRVNVADELIPFSNTQTISLTQRENTSGDYEVEICLEEGGSKSCLVSEKLDGKASFTIDGKRTVVKYDLESKVAEEKVKKPEKKAKKKTRQVEKITLEPASCSDYVRKIITEKAKTSSYEPEKVVRRLELGGGECYRNNSEFRELVDKLAANAKENCSVRAVALRMTRDREILEGVAEYYEEGKCISDKDDASVNHDSVLEGIVRDRLKELFLRGKNPKTSGRNGGFFWVR